MKNLFLSILFILVILCNQAFAEEMSKSQQAIAFYNDNNIPAAMKILQSIPEADKTAQDWLLMGNLLQDNNKNSEAIFMYKRAILTDKNYYKPYYNLANMLLDEEKPLMAIDNYKTVTKLKPDFAYAYYNMGYAYLKLNEIKKAKRCFLKAIDLKNTVPEFQYNLALCHKKLNNNKKAQLHLDFYNKLMENN